MKNYYFFLKNGPEDESTNEDAEASFWVDDHQYIGREPHTKN